MTALSAVTLPSVFATLDRLVFVRRSTSNDGHSTHFFSFGNIARCEHHAQNLQLPDLFQASGQPFGPSV